MAMDASGVVCYFHTTFSNHLSCIFRFCSRSLLRDSLTHTLIDQIPGLQNDRKTLLGELNWIFTAVTDTIAWNVLPHGTTYIFPLAFCGFGDHKTCCCEALILLQHCRTFPEAFSSRFISCESFP